MEMRDVFVFIYFILFFNGENRSITGRSIPTFSPKSILKKRCSLQPPSLIRPSLPDGISSRIFSDF